MKSSFRFSAFLSVLVLMIATCGCGGGGTSTPPLAVHTDNATSVTQNAAVLNGTVNPNGTTANAWFEYGINPNLASYDNTINQDIVAGTETQPVDHSLAGLTSGTTYYFRLVASDGSGWVKGEIASFSTHNPPPTVTTDNATSITLNGATLNGSVNPNGGVTIAWFEYGPDPNLTTFTATDNQTLGSGRDPVAMDNTLSGLSSGATYFYRLVAASAEGEVEGPIKNFSTDFPPPAATTGSATNITTTSATFQGTVNPNGFSAEAWFEYGTDPSLDSYTETPHQAKGSGTTDQPVSATPIAPLNPWSTYYFRMVAGSTTDPGELTKGAICSFPTGEYYVAVGDSITWGSGDDFPADDVSLDGRNSGGGFEPILNDLLTAAKGFPHNIVNAGVTGHASADGAAAISTTLSNHPSADYFLIMYGTNDAWVPPIPSGKGLNPGNDGYSGSYKDHMQQIISAVLAAGKTPYLAKVPYSSQPLLSDASIREYNMVIDELVVANGITVTPPDFYTWFQSNPGQLPDTVHPNGTGYQSMADLWFNLLNQ
jgi:lysophospholipase L1-like esterase